MPFMSYRTPDLALESAGRLMKEGGAHMVKLEGGATQLEVIRQITAQGIPVCGHLGLLPQSVHKLGGYRVQGREAERAETIKQEALALQEVGIDMLVLECVPSALAAEITAAVEIPVIGIGAGVDCDGQVLVVHDMLGMNPRPPRFVKDFLQSGGSILQALQDYVSAVKSADFPTEAHGFK
jgi:3-methyl-2-oxobutanoate hydroxymethyltransferase